MARIGFLGGRKLDFEFFFLQGSVNSSGTDVRGPETLTAGCHVLAGK